MALSSTDGGAVAVLAPTGQDAALVVRVLGGAGITATAVPTVDRLCHLIRPDFKWDALVVAVEALDDECPLWRALQSQPAWSDIPLIVIVHARQPTASTMMDRLRMAGSVTIVERPFRKATLLSAVGSALRARRRQYEVRDLFEQQRQATRERDEFLSMASHELKTPLAALRIQVEAHQWALRTDPETACSADSVARLLATAERQVNRLVHVVDDMLDVARVSVGKLTIRPAEMDLAVLVEDVAEQFVAQIQANGSHLDLVVEPVRGVWDSYRLEQVVGNLFANTVRHAPGAAVRAEVRRVRGLAEVRVSDAGPGVAEQDRERIFERFEQAVDNRGGLGVGLYISRQIARAHGGELRLESILGKGSTFILELPASVSPLG